MEKYKCRVCGKEFDSLHIHLHKDEEKLLKERPKALTLFKKDIKPDHLAEYEKIENSISWTTGSELKCFCGGNIVAYSFGNDEYLSIEVQCEDCGFIWDED